MNSLRKTIIFIILFLIMVSTITAQNIDAVIGNSDSTSSFRVINSDGDTLFTIWGDGSVFLKNSNSIYPYDRIEMNTKEHLLLVDGMRGDGPLVKRDIELISGGDIIMETPYESFHDGGGIEIHSGGSNNPGEIHLKGGSADDGGSGQIVLHPGDGGPLNLYGGAHGSVHSTGGDVNIEASKGGTAGDVNIKSGIGDMIGAGNINLIGSNTFEGDGGSIIITTGISTSGFDPGEDGKLILNGSGTYSGTWTQSSDKRFKNKIKPLPDPTEKLNQLKPVTYELRKEKFPNRRFEEGEQIGLIAQDVEKLFPQLVKDDVDGYKTVDYTKLSVIAIEAIKNQNKKIENLEEKLAAFEKLLKTQSQLVNQLINNENDSDKIKVVKAN